MKSIELAKRLSNLAGRSGLKITKYTPEILMVVGIAGVVTSTVMACKATLRSEEILDEAHSKFKMIKEAHRRGEELKYSEMDYKKDMFIASVQTARDFGKLYGPAIVVGAVSIGCLIGSHNIMRNRNIALMAAYKGVDQAFKAYRKRVVEDYGDEVDYMFKNGLRAEVITTSEKDEEGKTKRIKKTKLVQDPNDPNSHSIYARFYDDGCREWSKSPEYNLVFLKSQQNYFNDILKIRGHVFLNEVYDALGIERTKAGQITGWVYDGDGDNYIDFGIFDKDNRGSRDFVNGYEATILLDFNVDGVIYDLI